MANNNGEYISRQLLLTKINNIALDSHGNSNYLLALSKVLAVVKGMDGRDINNNQNDNKKVAYICDGSACDPERASCKHGGPCRHTLKIEHAQHFFKCENSDGWFEVDKHIGGSDGKIT